MALSPVNVEGFGGLRLDLDPEEVGLGGAIDCLNVDLDRYGRVRSRDGYGQFDASAAAGQYYSVWPSVSNGVLALRSGSIDALNFSGSVIATQTGLSSLSGSAVLFGTPSASRAYFADTASALRWSGSAWTVLGATVPKGIIIGVTPWDNRLVIANTGSTGGPSGAASSGSHVWFSDAGAPETFGANNYLQLTPGDGEAIVSAVSWQNMLFVFKWSRLFVVYGTSTDSTGNPIFNYRAVSIPDCQTAVAGTDGVYFVGRNGVYRTTGGPAQQVSGALNPLFVGGTTSFWQSGEYSNSSAAPSLAWHQERLWVAVSTGGASYNNLVLVYQPRSQDWLAWAIPVNSIASVTTGSAPRPAVVFAYGTGGNHIGFMSRSDNYTTDAGTAITSRYRSGFGDLGLPGREKTIRQTELVGQGTVSLGWSRDMGAITTSSTGNVTLGTAPATARGMNRLAQNGELLSWQVSSVNGGAWQLNRFTPFIRRPRDPGEKSA